MEKTATDPGPLFAARTFVLAAVPSLVTYARTLPEGSLERETVRQALRELANAAIRIYPQALVEWAQGRALNTLEIVNAPDELGRIDISGVTVELYAQELARHLFVPGEDEV